MIVKRLEMEIKSIQCINAYCSRKQADDFGEILQGKALLRYDNIGRSKVKEIITNNSPSYFS